jgi:hypothetical protein
MLIGGRRMARIINRHMGDDGITLIRESAGSRNEYGEYVPGATTSVSLRAVVQPVAFQGQHTMRDMLPEGATLSDYRYIDILADSAQTIRPLRVGTNQTGADVFQFESLDWEVFDGNIWDRNGHISALLVRKDAQSD